MPPDYQLATSHHALTSPAERSSKAAIGFADGRAAAEKAEAVQRVRAARTVAVHSLDAEDRGVLLSMLGIAGQEPAPGTPPAAASQPATPDQQVEFEIGAGRKGPEAVSVRVP
ncbi:hypothetical protein CLV68_3475 [Actinokineospora cianjurensis]|uniref:Uncharacterized protein n=1 Tax=Actinokineospora cianjurensis TaxID=585224 RepID=A0A421B3Q5_9PSEU|nr:hypothetical protein CLV68_3475 [Actinokineospora cianjurensis]